MSDGPVAVKYADTQYRYKACCWLILFDSMLTDIMVRIGKGPWQNVQNSEMYVSIKWLGIYSAYVVILIKNKLGMFVCADCVVVCIQKFRG